MKFKDASNTMVITTKKIIRKEKPILVIFHDEEDGMWQFLDGNDADESCASIVSLEEVLLIDPTINLASDLPLGWVAWRENEKSKWEFMIQA